MAGETGRAADLLVTIDRRRGAVVSSLHESLRAAIHGGRLREGDALPATRRLAAELGIARASVVEAYERLAAEGFVTARPGSATRVADGAAATSVNADPPAVPAARYDLRAGGPDVELFPSADWSRVLARAARDEPDALAYGDPAGVPQLRASLAAYLARTRAVTATPEDVVVTGGVTQGLALVCRALRRRGDRVLAVENPGPNPLGRETIRHAGLDILPIPVDERGLRVDLLAASNARAVLVTPAHQYPTGCVLAADRRRALVRWARNERRLVIEDDYDAEFRYDRLAVAALQGLAPERVAYLGSASKILAPGLRLGWVVAPSWMRPAVAEEKQFDDFGSPTLGQLALAAMIDDGILGRHVRRARQAYRARRDTFVTAVARHLPGWEVRGVAAGLQALVVPDRPIDDREIVRRAYRAGIWLSSLAAFTEPAADQPPPTVRHGLVIGFAMTREASIDAAVAALAGIVRNLERERGAQLSAKALDTERAPS